MIHGEAILCFAPGPWDDIWRNRHHIMTRLAQANRVLYVEPWAYLRPMWRQWRGGRIRREDWTRPMLSRVSEGLDVWRPPLWAPRADGSLLGKATQWVSLSLLKRTVRGLGLERPILWLFLPDMGVYVGKFDEKLVIYHVVDEYAAYTGVSESWRPVMVKMEEQLARRADLVFVTSPRLLDNKRRLNSNVVLVPNAVDYGAFAAICDSDGPTPADVVCGERPIAGYVGAINDKVDLPLLLRVAHDCPDWNLILVGPVSVGERDNRKALVELAQMANVRLLGRKDVAAVPRYIMACDVCLLPYRVNEWTRSIDSLKVYEYMACGKPVVATDVPAARRHEGVVTIVGNPGNFGQAIVAARRQDNVGLRKRRQELARQNTWEKRLETLSASIEARMGRSACGGAASDIKER